MIDHTDTTSPARSTSLRRVVLAIGLTPLGLLMMQLSRGQNYDFEIFRNSLTGMLRGESVYDFAIHNASSQADVGFIYPPFASLLMLPLALLPHIVAKVGLALATTLLVVSVIFALIDRIYSEKAAAGGPTIGWVRTPLITTLIALAYPTVNNMGLGQVSFMLWALVLLDVIVLPPRWQGVLTGLAGAIKLEPMILLPYYLVTRQWRPAVNAAAVFTVATAVGGVLRWSDSLRYWLHPSVIHGSLGNLSRANNWSMYAALSRLGLTGALLTFCWAMLSALVLATALWRARRHFNADQPVEAVVVMGITATLINVATWPHHLLLLLVALALIALHRPLIGLPVLLVVTNLWLLPEWAIDNGAPILMLILVVTGLPRSRVGTSAPPPEAIPLIARGENG